MIYWQHYRAWLLKVLNERIYLSRRGYAPNLLEPADSLKKLLIYHGYRSNPLLAGFILRKSELIKTLIPNNKSHEQQLVKLKTAIAEAQKVASITAG